MARASNPKIPLAKEKAVIVLYREMTAFDVGAAVNLSERTVFRIAHDAGVRKRGGWTGPPAAGAFRLGADPRAPAPTSAASRTAAPLDDTPLSIASAALARALEALAAGDAAAAQAYIKAGLAVGEFAELVKLLRKRDGGG